MATIICSGPGPHAPEDGRLGETDDSWPQPPGGALCAACARAASGLPPVT